MTNPNKPQGRARPIVEVVKPTYQPSRAELEADLRVDATFKQGVKALAKDVEIKHVDKPTSGG